MNKTGIKQFTRWSSFPSLLLLAVFFVLNIFITTNFLTVGYMSGFFAANTPLICVSIGVGVVIMAGGIDISLGGMVSLINVCCALMGTTTLHPALIILICLAMGLGMGLLNGFIVGVLRVSPMLATFGASSIYSGLALWIMPLPTGKIAKPLVRFYGGTVLGFIPSPVLFITLILVIALLIKYSKLGMYIMASGRHELKAYVSGVPVNKVRVIAYLFAGFCAAIGGIAMSFNSGGGDPKVGATLSMNSLAACVIGGIGLAGGKGDAWGALFGAIFFQLVTSVVMATGVSSFYQNFVKGLILLIGMVGSIVVFNRMEAAQLQESAQE